MFRGQDGEITGDGEINYFDFLLCTGEKKVAREKRAPEISKEFLQGLQLSTDLLGN